MDRWSISGDGGSHQDSDECADDAPDTVKEPPWFMDPDAAPDTLPSPGNADYATDIILNTGCEVAPESAAITALHARETLCEHLSPVAMRIKSGSFHEVITPFLWDVAHPAIVSLTFPYTPTDSVALARGKIDLFDGDQEHEPETTVWACAMNDCPKPRPSDCTDRVCASVRLISVVNIEGTWTLSGVTFEPGDTMNPLQDGRSFKDPVAGVKKGIVEGKTLRFEIDDYRYTGIVSPDRTHLTGEVLNLMNYAVIGLWSAERQES